MKYKGYNIAIHELGHNVEQVFSLNEMDYYTLEGVPNTAFTEALAFVFQARDLDLLGLDTADPQSEDLSTLDDFWSAYEIAGVSLVDMNIWRWMYEHPDASAAEVRDAMISIAKDVWNQYFAPVFGMKDQILLAIYSHIIDGGMYIPDYFIGSAIAFQIEDYLKDKNLAFSGENPSPRKIKGKSFSKASTEGYSFPTIASSFSSEYFPRGLKPVYQISNGSSFLPNRCSIREATFFKTGESRKVVSICSTSSSRISLLRLKRRSINEGVLGVYGSTLRSA